MSQDQAIVLCLKVGLIAGFAVLVAWVAVYSKITEGDAWRNPIGLTFIFESLLIAGVFVPSALSLFWHLNRLDSYIAAWTDVTMIGLVAPVMAWRTLVFLRQPWLGRVSRNGNSRTATAQKTGSGNRRRALWPLLIAAITVTAVGVAILIAFATT